MSSNNENTGIRLPRLFYSPAWWAIVMLAGIGLFVLVMIFGDTRRVWESLLVNFVMFTPMSAAMVVWPAIVMASRGTWLRQVEFAALTGLSFAPVSLLLFGFLIIGSPYWAAWMHHEHLHNSAWLNAPFLFSRDGAALIFQWILSLIFVIKVRKGGTPKKLAAWLILSYALVFSLLGFDLVMALDAHWFSALFGAYFMISGVYAAIAAWTAGSLFRSDVDVSHKSDMGKLIVAFSLLTTYFMYSQLIVIWYENLPHEVRQVLPRLEIGPWNIISAVLLGLVYLGPLWLLLTRGSKRNKYYLAAISILIVSCLWLERWWEVIPTLHGAFTFGFAEITTTIAVLGAFLFGASLLSKRLPY
jgi:hypothetical protein